MGFSVIVRENSEANQSTEKWEASVALLRVKDKVFPNRMARDVDTVEEISKRFSVIKLDPRYEGLSVHWLCGRKSNGNLFFSTLQIRQLFSTKEEASAEDTCNRFEAFARDIESAITPLAFPTL